jgi:hypothetical protein
MLPGPSARNARRLKRGLRLLVISVSLAMAALNVVAYRHAYALTHFTPGGTRTSRPESLSFSEKLRVLTVGPPVPKPVNHRSPRDLGLEYERHVFQGAHGLPLEAGTFRVPRARA